MTDFRVEDQFPPQRQPRTGAGERPARAVRPGASAVVLASTSATRAMLLRRAGLDVETVAPAIDEAHRKRALRQAGTDGEALAVRLAEEKAGSVVACAAGRPVIGADQVLLLGDAVFDKPVDRAEAAAQLRALSGRWHRLASAVCVLRAGRPAWRHTGRALLCMRRFDDRFIESYLARIGSEALQGPGAYRIEGLGIQLFQAVEGCHATILGLPLLPLLAHLRDRGVIAA